IPVCGEDLGLCALRLLCCIPTADGPAARTNQHIGYHNHQAQSENVHSRFQPTTCHIVLVSDVRPFDRYRRQRGNTVSLLDQIQMFLPTANDSSGVSRLEQEEAWILPAWRA